MPKLKKFVRALSYLSAAVLLGGCYSMNSRGREPAGLLEGAGGDAPKASAPAVPAAPVGAGREELMEADRAFAKLAIQKGVAEAFHAYAADDAAIFPLGELPVEGRDAIRVAMATGPDGQLRWTPHKAQLSKDGTMGYTWGFYELRTPGPDGLPVLKHGKYLTVWVRTEGGSWKFVADIGNLGPPPRESSN